MRKQLPLGANLWYLLANIVTLGAPYFVKIVIMKALIDAQER